MSGRRHRFQIKPKVGGSSDAQAQNTPAAVPAAVTCSDGSSAQHDIAQSSVQLSKPIPPITVEYSKDTASDAATYSSTNKPTRRARFHVKPQICKLSDPQPPVNVHQSQAEFSPAPASEGEVSAEADRSCIDTQSASVTIADKVTVVEESVTTVEQGRVIEVVCSSQSNQRIVVTIARDKSPCILPSCPSIHIEPPPETVLNRVENDIANLNDLLESSNNDIVDYDGDNSSIAGEDTEVRTRFGRVSKPRPSMKADQVWKTSPKRSRTESTKSSSNSSSKRMSGLEEIDRSTFTMADLIRYNPKNPEAMAGKDELPPPFKKKKKGSKRGQYDEADWKTKMELGVKEEEQMETKYVAPQVKFSADGSLVVDESSMLVECETEKKVFERVGEQNTRVTCMSFFRRQMNHTKLWSNQETEMFYRLLPATGTDFWLMSEFFPNRSRTELKNKFKRESKKFPHKVKDAMSKPCLLDPRVFDLAPGKGQQKKKVKLEKKIASNVDPEKADDEEGNCSTESEAEGVRMSERKKTDIATMRKWEEEEMAGRTREQVKAQFEIPSRYGRTRKLREEAVQSFAALTCGVFRDEDTKPDVKNVSKAQKLQELADKVADKNVEVTGDKKRTKSKAKPSAFAKFEPSTEFIEQKQKEEDKRKQNQLNMNPNDIMSPEKFEEMVKMAKESKDGNVVISLSDNSNEQLILAVEKSKKIGKPDMVHFYKVTKHPRAGPSDVAPVCVPSTNVNPIQSSEDAINILD